jgi:hypothetical protein
MARSGADMGIWESLRVRPLDLIAIVDPIKGGPRCERRFYWAGP